MWGTHLSPTMPLYAEAAKCWDGQKGEKGTTWPSQGALWQAGPRAGCPE